MPSRIPSDVAALARSAARTLRASPLVSRRLTQRAERGSDLGAENRGLLPCREVAALFGRVEIDELVIGLLRPTARRLIAFARKDRHGGRDGDVGGVVKVDLIFPIEAGPPHPRVPHPGERAP